MKKIAANTLILITMMASCLIAQDIINPYQLYPINVSPPIVQFTVSPTVSATVYNTNDENRTSGYYVGEYMILLRHNHLDKDWLNFFSQVGVPSTNLPDINKK